MGALLESYESSGRDVDLVVRREVGLAFPLPRDDRPTLVFLRGASRCMASSGASGSFALTSTSLLLCAVGAAIELHGESSVAHVILLRPSAARARETIAENALDSTAADRVFGGVRKLRLSRWMDDLVDRYDFEARLNARTPAQCPFFLEKQILNECVRLALPDVVPTTGELLGEISSDLIARALAYLDAHVFEPLTPDSVAAALRCSLSQLNKTFQKELGRSPISYLVQLRLERAATHLERGDWTAQDLSLLCRFSDLSSFSRAFKQKFGVSPSRYRASILGA